MALQEISSGIYGKDDMYRSISHDGKRARNFGKLQGVLYMCIMSMVFLNQLSSGYLLI